MELISTDPTNEEVIAYYPVHDEREVLRRLQAAQAAYVRWKHVPFSQRRAFVSGLASQLQVKKAHLAELMAREMGKRLKEGEAEIEKCAAACLYFAEQAESFLAAEPVKGETKAEVLYQPLGPVLAIMPWNFPFWQVIRAAVPALMAGNVMLLKHASNVTGCALALESLFSEAGFPPGCFAALLVPSDRLDPLIAHEAVAAVTLTGSAKAGRDVASKAGASLKKTVLELGGSDPYLVLEDADMAQAAKHCAASRLLNNGQSCIAAKRFIVAKAAYAEFLEALKAEFEKVLMGSPLESATTLSALARKDLRRDLHAQVQTTAAQGAQLIMGGILPGRTGFFYPPTILAGATPGMAAFDEETFGPVAVILEAQDEKDAVHLANCSRFGLGAAIFTSDEERGKRLARELEAGQVFINDFVRSDPRLPFGGVKESGYGRELGHWGLREFMNVKTIFAA